MTPDEMLALLRLLADLRLQVSQQAGEIAQLREQLVAALTRPEGEA